MRVTRSRARGKAVEIGLSFHNVLFALTYERVWEKTRGQLHSKNFTFRKTLVERSYQSKVYSHYSIDSSESINAFGLALFLVRFAVTPELAELPGALNEYWIECCEQYHYLVSLST